MNAPEKTVQTAIASKTDAPKRSFGRVMLSILKGTAEVGFLFGLLALVLSVHLFPIWLGVMVLCAAVQFIPGSKPYPIANSTALGLGVSNASTPSAPTPTASGEDALVMIVVAFAFLLAPFLTMMLPTFIIGLFAPNKRA